MKVTIMSRPNAYRRLMITAAAPPLFSEDRATSWMWPKDACSSLALLRWVVEDAAKHVLLPASWWERTICTAVVYSGNADTLKVARQLGFKLHSNTWMMAAGLSRIDMLELIESDCCYETPVRVRCTVLW